MLAVVDLAVSLAMRGMLGCAGGRWQAPPRGSALGCWRPRCCTPAAKPRRRRSRPTAAPCPPALSTRLAYVRSGDPRVDQVSAAGLVGLGIVVNRRTAAELGEPVGVDPETDELAFYPLLYWPLADAAAAAFAANAARKLTDYMRNGGTIVFDTRGRSDGSDRAGLRDLARALDLPPLIPVPEDQCCAGPTTCCRTCRGGGPAAPCGSKAPASTSTTASVRWWRDPTTGPAAWAMDDAQRPLFAVAPGGERQREQAYRFGVNLVMYVLTGNYKADQVHLSTILERLGAMSADIVLQPMLPAWLLALLLVPALLLLVLAVVRRARGWTLRALALLALAAALLDPRIVSEQRQPRPDVALVVIDESASQKIGDREAVDCQGGDGAAGNALAGARRRRGADDPYAGDAAAGETRLFDAIERAALDDAAGRLAAVFVISDGQVHDVPAPGSVALADGAAACAAHRPARTSVDRRLVVEQAPAFGLVDQQRRGRLPGRGHRRRAASGRRDAPACRAHRRRRGRQRRCRHRPTARRSAPHPPRRTDASSSWRSKPAAGRDFDPQQPRRGRRQRRARTPAGAAGLRPAASGRAHLAQPAEVRSGG